MEIAELERMERSARLRLATSPQRAARMRELEHMRRIIEDKAIRPSPEQYAEGLALARRSLRDARRRR